MVPVKTDGTNGMELHLTRGGRLGLFGAVLRGKRDVDLVDDFTDQDPGRQTDGKGSELVAQARYRHISPLAKGTMADLGDRFR